MSGHIRERAGAWEVRLSAGTDPATGRRRMLTRTVHGSREAAEYILHQLQVLDEEQRPRRPRRRRTRPPATRYRRDPVSGKYRVSHEPPAPIPPRATPPRKHATPPEPAQRWPLEPLLEAAGRPPLAALARWCHAHQRQVYRWREYGLSDEWADRAAILLGLHPALVWDGW